MTSTPAPATPTSPAQSAQTTGLPPTDPAQGLSQAEAAQRLARFGANAIADKTTPAWQQLLLKFWAPVP